jgi:hypothetical protein
LLLLLPFITHLGDIKIGQFSQFWTIYNNGCQSNCYYQLLLLCTCKCKILCIWNHLISRLGNYLYMHELNHDPSNRIKQMFLGHLWNSQEYKEWSFITLYSNMGLPCGNKWKIVVNWYYLWLHSFPNWFVLTPKQLFCLHSWKIGTLFKWVHDLLMYHSLTFTLILVANYVLFSSYYHVSLGCQIWRPKCIFPFTFVQMVHFTSLIILS